ncbi:MAG: tRNA (adenosine(37)-N6)-dimethylallyltransferase MiaA [Bacteroidales bacterium]|nr:tRNA (adenosine(37)-N6)-dimethylallyltransferase MiaA [Bacteroidales bacterium]
MDKKPTLLVITGPTGSGKTALAIDVAQRLGTDIIGADSRQIYKGMPIGTAAPTPEQRALVAHHFVETLPLDAYYSAAMYEEQVLELLPSMWEKGEVAVMCGGSMMYIDAVTYGIDNIPTISSRVRQEVKELYNKRGLDYMLRLLERLDPASYARLDQKNWRRIIHAIEICIEAGCPASAILTGKAKERPFRVVKVAIGYEREELFERINRRVDDMIARGLEAEAEALYPQRHLNALNTVGYKEMFAMMEGRLDRPTAIARIAKNTRVYAKKQMLWLRKDDTVKMLAPTRALDGVMEELDQLNIIY